MLIGEINVPSLRFPLFWIVGGIFISRSIPQRPTVRLAEFQSFKVEFRESLDNSGLGLAETTLRMNESRNGRFRGDAKPDSRMEAYNGVSS